MKSRFILVFFVALFALTACGKTAPVPEGFEFPTEPPPADLGPDFGPNDPL